MGVEEARMEESLWLEAMTFVCVSMHKILRNNAKLAYIQWASDLSEQNNEQVVHPYTYEYICTCRNLCVKCYLNLHNMRLGMIRLK